MARILTPKIGKLADMPGYTNALLFGDSGSGKTTLMATAPKTKEKPLLIINIDNSLQSITNLASEPIAVFPDPAEGRPVETWEELDEIVSWLEAGNAEQFTTIGIDTITEAGYLLKKKILSEEGPTRRNHPLNFSQADYGVFADIMLNFVRRLRNLRANVVVTAQPQDLLVENPGGGGELVRMANFGAGQKTPSEAVAHFDLAGYLGVEVKDGKLLHKLLVQPVGNRRAKIRTRPGVEAPTVIEKPNLTEVFKLIGKE